MQGSKLTLSSGRRFAIVARSGSYTICWQSLPSELQVVPDGVTRWHPISVSPYAGTLECDESPVGLCCMVRNPIDRFRSSCARQRITAEVGLTLAEFDVHFWTLKAMGLLEQGVTHFRFPDQINDCAEWLGLTTPVTQRNEESDENKPTLTPDEEARVREIYADDIALWESLQ